jgi:hypothetical protein
MVISSDIAGTSSQLLLSFPLVKAILKDFEMTSKNPEWMVEMSKDVIRSAEVI